jgi:hypothetical protein
MDGPRVLPWLRFPLHPIPEKALSELLGFRNCKRDIIALLFLFDKYKLQINYTISYFYLYLILRACAVRFNATGNLKKFGIFLYSSRKILAFTTVALCLYLIIIV